MPRVTQEQTTSTSAQESLLRVAHIQDLRIDDRDILCAKGYPRARRGTPEGAKFRLFSLDALGGNSVLFICLRFGCPYLLPWMQLFVAGHDSLGFTLAILFYISYFVLCLGRRLSCLPGKSLTHTDNDNIVLALGSP
jgi:hypothetical protein